MRHARPHAKRKLSVWLQPVRGLPPWQDGDLEEEDDEWGREDGGSDEERWSEDDEEDEYDEAVYWEMCRYMAKNIDDGIDVCTHAFKKKKNGDLQEEDDEWGGEDGGSDEERWSEDKDYEAVYGDLIELLGFD